VVDLLTDQLRTMAEHFPDEVGYKDLARDESLTFRAWEARSNRLARGLRAAGISKGDRVSVYLPPEEVIDWVVAYAAVHKAGAVAVPTSTRLAPRELQFVFEHAEIRAVLHGRSLGPVVDELTAAVPSLKLAGQAPFDDLLEADDGAFQVALSGEDMADIMYTSGTTGRPKGVVVRHRNAALVPNGVPKWTGAGWMHASPLFTFAGIACVYNPMKLGMEGLYLPKFDTGQWMACVARERPVAVFLVPAMAQLLLADPQLDEADLSSIRLCSLGSAPLPPDTQRRLQERMPQATVTNGYGMTEAGPAYCTMPREEAGRRVGSVGRPLPPAEFHIVDEEGRPRPAGEVGELVIRMPGREREYYRDPEATARTWRDDGLHTGDLAYLDQDGYLYIVGRIKDVIIRGGNNVHAADVEAALHEHPDVVEAAVAGIPHQVLGEDVAAWVVPRPGAQVDAEGLRAFCLDRLADYKVPRRITFVSELPRNATGKVLKGQLVDPANV
jgi:acyl-CoA synthetase (AMP-forming)/AMP-acid ligase II